MSSTFEFTALEVSFDVIPSFPVGSRDYGSVSSNSVLSFDAESLLNTGQDEFVMTIEDIQTAVGPRAIDPSFSLALTSPNPTRRTISAEYSLPRDSHVRIDLVDLQGRIVTGLRDGLEPAGRHSVTWDPAGEVPGAGIYFVRAVANGEVLTHKVVVAR